MILAAIYIGEGLLPHIFGENHEELTINLGGAYIYTLKDGHVVKKMPNEFHLDDILDSYISLFSCVVGGNGGGKTTLLKLIMHGPDCIYIIEDIRGAHKVWANLDKLHRIYYTPYLLPSILDVAGTNGKDLSKLALIKLDNHGDGGQLDDFLQAHNSENTKRWIRFNHFFRQMPVSKISLPSFERVEFSLGRFEANIHNSDKFHDTSYKLRPAITLLFDKIEEERNRQEIEEQERRERNNDDSDRWAIPIKFEYLLYEIALGKLVSILERRGNRYLSQGYIPDDYEIQLRPLTVREGIEWFLRNAGVHSGEEQYPFTKHLILLELVDYVLSLIKLGNLADDWDKMIINEKEALQVIELFDTFNNSFVNNWFKYDPKPMFGFLPQINVSSGEQQFLNLFSTLYYHDQNIQANVDVDLHSSHSLKNISRNIMLLLDEGDNAFHPQWKKEYVNYLRTIIPLIFAGYTIQIIITSHDPLTLSDLPKNNVVFLEKGMKGTVVGDSSSKRTFGANISDLLKDSFFLEDGQIGSYVAQLIDLAITDIQNNNLDEPRRGIIERIIHAIDEPIIKFKLAEMLSEATGDNNFEKQLLDEEIARLRKKRGDL